MRLSLLIIGDDWEHQLHRYCSDRHPLLDSLKITLLAEQKRHGFASDVGQMARSIIAGEPLLNLASQPPIPQFVDYRLGGIYRGSLLAAPGSEFVISPPVVASLEQETPRWACDRVRAGDVDWSALDELRQRQGQAQFRFLRSLTSFYGVEEASSQLGLFPAVVRRWLLDQEGFIRSEYRLLRCHALLVDGYWSPAGDQSFFSARPSGELPVDAWHRQLSTLVHQLPDNTWLTVAECLTD